MIYFKDNAIADLLHTAIKKQTVVLAFTIGTKTKANALLLRAGLQLPGGQPSDDFNSKISDPGSPVKASSTNQTETQQFKR